MARLVGSPLNKRQAAARGGAEGRAHDGTRLGECRCRLAAAGRAALPSCRQAPPAGRLPPELRLLQHPRQSFRLQPLLLLLRQGQLLCCHQHPAASAPPPPSPAGRACAAHVPCTRAQRGPPATAAPARLSAGQRPWGSKTRCTASRQVRWVGEVLAAGPPGSGTAAQAGSSGQSVPHVRKYRVVAAQHARQQLLPPGRGRTQYVEKMRTTRSRLPM